MKSSIYHPIIFMSFFLLISCAESQQPIQHADEDKLSVATFAGGCFWCTEADFEKVPGVYKVISGFSGGKISNPSYEEVSAGKTRHVESVQVFYDATIISYDQLLQAFWRQINPTDGDGQFVDRGKHYRSVIFYHNQDQQQQALQSKQQLQASGRYDKDIVTEIVPYTEFFKAEEYHQDYYKKNPLRYKYYRFGSGRDQYLAKVWGDDLKLPVQSKTPWQKPSDEELRQRLSPLQYRVTQQEGTEPAFKNTYWDEKRPGIYVDIVTGEPLFSSKDKYKSGTGWPSFTRPLEPEHIVEKTDYLLLYPRTELRSKHGDSHLGHVFNDGPEPTGLRYCINSAALRFIPAQELASKGYEKFAEMFAISE